jgi:hypothetical protein
MVVRTMVRKLGLPAIGRTRDMSSLSSLTGCSATGVNRAGGRVPKSGCSQRASDSAATTRPEDSSTSGWQLDRD